ncbi:MAG: PstS family phosphate ABC transporter substrate-binding protein [Woeseia sp.]
MTRVPGRSPFVALTFALGMIACSGPDETIRIDGSSTVYPVEAAWAEEFGPGLEARITVAFSGTGAGFQKFCRGEIDVSGASRPIADGENSDCAVSGIDPFRIEVGQDGLAVVVPRSNDFVDHLTVTELNRIWTADQSKQVNRWGELRENWPDREIQLFGAGTDSGTFDYFIEVIIHPFDGSDTKGRSDYTPSEDDNVLVQGVAGSDDGLGYFGLAYARENAERLRIVPIVDDTDGEAGDPVMPTDENVESGRYSPLSRPLFMYTDGKPVGVLAEFFRLGLSEEGQHLVQDVGYVRLSESTRLANLEKLD